MKSLWYIQLFFSFLTYAQSTDNTEYFKFGEWSDDLQSYKVAYVFADLCNIRKEPSTKSDTLGKINIGTKVKILEIAKETYTTNGITSNWLKISTNKLSGYVLGGALTNGYIKLNETDIAVWGIIRKDDNDENQKTYASIRIATLGKIKNKVDFEVTYGSQPDFGFLSYIGSPNLEGNPMLFTYESISEACGVYASTHYFLYNNEKMTQVGSGYSMGDGGVFHTSKSYVFPLPVNEEQTRDYHYSPNKDHIFILEIHGEYDDECIWVETIKVNDFIWKEGKLEKSCDY